MLCTVASECRNQRLCCRCLPRQSAVAIAGVVSRRQSGDLLNTCADESTNEHCGSNSGDGDGDRFCLRRAHAPNMEVTDSEWLICSPYYSGLDLGRGLTHCPAMISVPNPQADSPHLRRKTRGRLTPNPKATLQEQVHEVMRFFHYSPRTEEAYWQWIVRFLRFHRVPDPGAERGTGNAEHLTPPHPQPLSTLPEHLIRPVAALTPSPSPIRWARVASDSPHRMRRRKIRWARVASDFLPCGESKPDPAGRRGHVLRAGLKIRHGVEQATGLWRQVTSRPRVSAAGCRRKRAGSPGHPLFQQALSRNAGSRGRAADQSRRCNDQPADTSARI